MTTPLRSDLSSCSELDLLQRLLAIGPELDRLATAAVEQSLRTPKRATPLCRRCPGSSAGPRRQR